MIIKRTSMYFRSTIGSFEYIESIEDNPLIPLQKIAS